MTWSLGDPNPELTKAIKRLAAVDTANVKFLPHALTEMTADGFDHDDVLTCLRKGTAHGPEIQHKQLRANVIHRGLHIRVVVGGLDDINQDWSQLQLIRVVTVMKAD